MTHQPSDTASRSPEIGSKKSGDCVRTVMSEIAVGMLVTTNDAFFGLNSVRPRGRSTTYRVSAYDAGSEANNEDCDFIPGPPCGNPGVRDTDQAEGFVHIHNGVHGIAESEGGLVPSRDDWRNPVAQITVVRVSDDDEDDDD